MILIFRIKFIANYSYPRVSGGDPMTQADFRNSVVLSPRERG